MANYYFPEHRHLQTLTLVRRERRLPDDATGKVEKANNSRVSVKEVIARGTKPAPYAVVDAARLLRLSNPDKLDDLLQVIPHENVARGQFLAGKTNRRGAPKRGKAVFAPIDGVVTHIGGGLIVIQEMQETVDVESGLNGVVVGISEDRRAATIESYGAVLQGAWGNGKRIMGVLRVEPDEGFESAYNESVDAQYRGAVVFTRRPLRALSLQVMDDQGFAGIIAPSMEPDLIEMALNARGGILLTEGFGSQRMNPTYVQFLTDLVERQIMLDAVTPTAQTINHPEAIITVPLPSGVRPTAPPPNLALSEGIAVNVVRGDGTTATGIINNLPNTPVMLDNGLRVMCALVKMTTGETTHVPLANIEIYG